LKHTRPGSLLCSSNEAFASGGGFSVVLREDEQPMGRADGRRRACRRVRDAVSMQPRSR
jgi:hypothetical protein